jgi:hypothetical protein
VASAPAQFIRNDLRATAASAQQPHLRGSVIYVADVTGDMDGSAT